MKIGSFNVVGDVIQSPMAGYSDVPFRSLCRSFGSSMSYSEFVPVEGVLGNVQHLRRELDYLPEERPVVFQLFGNDAGKMLDAALILQDFGPDIIDINMGCSTRRVSSRGAGVGMMPKPYLVRDTFELLSANLSVPVTGKIRLGWDEAQRNYLEIATIMEDSGAAAIAMHARTKSQKYGGKADWEAISRLRDHVSVPVIGNGDVKRPEDIDAMRDLTGCDAVMIGRSAIGNPWIFQRRDREDVHFAELIDIVEKHLKSSVAYYDEGYGVRLFRKHLKQYFQGLDIIANDVGKMLAADSEDQLLSLLSNVSELIDPGQTLGKLTANRVSALTS